MGCDDMKTCQYVNISKFLMNLSILGHTCIRPPDKSA